MKKTLIIIGALALALAAFYGLSSVISRQNTQPGKEEAGLKTYTNASNGYSLAYPSNLQVKEYTPENTTIGRIEGDMVSSVADVSVITIKAAPGETFISAVTDQMRNMCAADGPTTTYSCTGISKLQPFETRSGLRGYSFYLDGELKALKTGEVEKTGKGPFFAFLSKTGATASKIIAVHAPMNIFASQSDSAAIRSIAESLQITESEDANLALNMYISENLSQLSPSKAQPGKTFFITKIEAHGGTGTISYGDGEKSYTADFIYSVDEQGKVSVTDFKIRQ